MTAARRLRLESVCRLRARLALSEHGFARVGRLPHHQRRGALELMVAAMEQPEYSADPAARLVLSAAGDPDQPWRQSGRMALGFVGQPVSVRTALLNERADRSSPALAFLLDLVPSIRPARLHTYTLAQLVSAQLDLGIRPHDHPDHQGGP